MKKLFKIIVFIILAIIFAGLAIDVANYLHTYVGDWLRSIGVPVNDAPMHVQDIINFFDN